MTPANAYRKSQTVVTGPTRIDLLLALYDGACERLAKSKAALASDDRAAAVRLVGRVQLIVMELAAGVRPEVDNQLGDHILRLYEYVTNQLREVTADSIESSLKVMETLREGFRAIREEAVNLEKTGQISSVPDATLLTANI